MEIKSLDFSSLFGGYYDPADGLFRQHPVELRQTVAWINRAVVMTANAVAQIPYTITQGGEPIDERVAWGGVRNPRTLIHKIAASLCSGAAYAVVDAGERAIVAIDYVSPHTVRPRVVNGALVGFERLVNNRAEPISLDRMFWAYYPDDTVDDNAPPNIYPVKNAILSAGIIAAMDATIRGYGERGFIPPTLLAVKGQPTTVEREKAETWWNNFLRGWTRTVAKILNAESVDVRIVGAGINELRGSYTEIVNQQIRNIAAAFNIPVSLFLSDAANYATMGGERRTWYETGVIVSLYQTIEDSLNVQIFGRYGREFRFVPESMPVFQDDENAKSGSLSALASTFAANPDAALVAAEILGYALTPAQIEKIEALKRPASPPPQMPALNAEQKSARYDDVENAIADEVLAWRKFAIKRAGKRAARDFEPRVIPPALALEIKSRLIGAETPDVVNAVFDVVGAEMPAVRAARIIEGLHDE